MRTANLLWDREIPFRYEVPLFAPDGTFFLPDFTITWHGDQYYWEHFGRLDLPDYKARAEFKRKWYAKHFGGPFVETEESPELSKNALAVVQKHFAS